MKDVLVGEKSDLMLKIFTKVHVFAKERNHEGASVKKLSSKSDIK